MSNKFIKQVKNEIKKQERKEEQLFLIPSGSTLLNCACSNSPYGAYKAGTIITLPGASASGKTMLLFTMFAEICGSEKYNDYEIIYDDAEEAYSMDTPRLFGKSADERVRPPAIAKDGEPIYSETIQDFQNNILLQIKKGNPFIYALDSLDSLSSDEEMEREYKKALLSAKNPDAIKELKGSYKTEKARIIGQCLRMVRRKIKNTNSLLIIVQQERANMNAGPYGKKEITSGGRAPFYYSSHQVWTKKIKSIKKDGTKIGNRARAIITKNKLTGKERSVEFDIYDEYGIDDIGSQIDFLIKEGFWKKKGNEIVADELNISGKRSILISKIESNGLQKKLKKITGRAWVEKENKLKMNREPKYGS